MKNRFFLLFIVQVITYGTNIFSVQSQTEKKINWFSSQNREYRLKGGANIGGTPPMPLPAEIRKIKSYNPTLALTLEGDIYQWITPQWGIMLGVKFEDKGMKTEARVKNYRMEMTSDDGKMKGAWTGPVKTKIKNSYVSVPIMGVYKISPQWEVKAGAVFSWLLEGSFTGSTFDGYLRDTDPTGEKTQVTYATYDFSDELSKFLFAVQCGAEWKAFNKINIFADFNWGLTSIFPDSFETITFGMYPVYLNIGFAYTFR